MLRCETAIYHSRSAASFVGIGLMKFCLRFGVACTVLTGSMSMHASGLAATIVVGPGPQPLIYENYDLDYHILGGTSIITPSRTGPPVKFVVVTDAIEMRGGGHTQIDGGLFRGGDASYTVPGGFATVAGGTALHLLNKSSGKVHDGSFIGGDASGYYPDLVQAGSAVNLRASKLIVFGGYYEGGTATEFDRFGALRSMVQAPAIGLYNGSRLYMHGGLTNGSIFIAAGAIGVFGTNLNFDGSNVSGVYADGTPFSHTITGKKNVLFNPAVISEPATIVFAAIAYAFCCAVAAFEKLRRDLFVRLPEI